MAAPRYLVALVVAGGVSLALFGLMQALVSGEVGWEEPGRGPVIEFVRLERDSELERKRRRPEKAQPQRPPPPPALDFARAERPGQPRMPGRLLVDRSVHLAGGLWLGPPPGDADVVPLVRVRPHYPARAMARDLEGWVEVEFTITAEGAVADARVVGADPPGVFDRAALRAIAKWRYNPRIEDGRAVERPGQRVVIDFGLEGE